MMAIIDCYGAWLVKSWARILTPSSLNIKQSNNLPVVGQQGDV
jgi:hypothetical protein